VGGLGRASPSPDIQSMVVLALSYNLVERNDLPACKAWHSLCLTSSGAGKPSQ